MNVCTFIGRLTADPIVNIRHQDNGAELKVVTFSVAVRRAFKNKQTGNYDADFIPCVAFGNSAEYCEKYFHQGLRVAVSGHLQTPDRYTDQNGNIIYPNNQLVLEKQEIAESLAEQQRQQQSTQSVPAGNTQNQQNNRNTNYAAQNQNQNYPNGYQQPVNNTQVQGAPARNQYNNVGQDPRGSYQPQYQQPANNNRNGGQASGSVQNNNGYSQNNNGYQQQQSQYQTNHNSQPNQNVAAQPQQSQPVDYEYDGFMNIPDGLEEELPFN